MAQKVLIELEDDKTGGPATQTIEYMLDGKHYQIDLNDKNAAALRGQVEKWVTISRPVKVVAGKRGKRGGPRASHVPAATMERADARTIRAWAAEHGVAVNERGRIPADVIEQYNNS